METYLSWMCIYYVYMSANPLQRKQTHTQKNPYFEAQILKRSQNKMAPMHIRIRVRTEVVPYSRVFSDTSFPIPYLVRV